MFKLDITDIKAQNTKRILDALRFSEGVTKRDLTVETGLSFSTVSNICNELKDNGVLWEEKTDDFSVGRTPNRLIFSSKQYCSICFDMQQENLLNFAVLDFSNNLLHEEHFDISNIDDAHQLVSFIKAAYQEMLLNCDYSMVQFVGVGVSIPGIFDQKTQRVVDSTIDFLNDTPIQKLISEQLNIPCYVENESNLCALSARQNHLDCNNVVYVHSSAGLGVGVVCDGKLLRGENGYAAEIAHIPFGDLRVTCPSCGNPGCIENDLAQRGMDIIHFPRLEKEELQMLIADRGKKLGKLLSVIINLFDPGILYIGGNAMVDFDRLVPNVMSVLQKHSHMSLKRGLKILHDSNSTHTIEKGINQIVYENWFPLSKKH